MFASLYWHSAELRGRPHQGNLNSLLRIGDAHYYGRGTAVDLNKSVAVYRQATQLRSAQAMFNLALMHEHGWGLDKDLHLAKRFYDMAESASAEATVPVLLAKIKLAAHIWAGACARMQGTLATTRVCSGRPRFCLTRSQPAAGAKTRVSRSSGAEGTGRVWTKHTCWARSTLSTTPASPPLRS